MEKTKEILELLKQETRPIDQIPPQKDEKFSFELPIRWYKNLRSPLVY